MLSQSAVLDKYYLSGNALSVVVNCFFYWWDIELEVSEVTRDEKLEFEDNVNAGKFVHEDGSPLQVEEEKIVQIYMYIYIINL